MTGKIVLVWPNFEPTNASGVRARSFAAHLAKLGWDVRVVTHPDPQATRDPPAPVETMDLFLHPRHAPALLGGTGKLARRLRELAPDVAVVSSPSLTFAWQAARACRRAGVPYVADVRDLFAAEMRAAFGDRARYRLAERLEASFLRHAARVTVVTDLLRERLLRDFPDVAPERCVVVRNGADPVPAPAVPPRKDLDVLYVGEMFDRGRSGEALLEAFARVLKSRPQTRFAFVGWNRNPYSDRLLELAPAEVRAALDLHGRVPREEVARYTQRAKLGLVPLHRDDVFRGMLPAKAYEYLVASLPMVVLGHDGDSEMRRFVEGHDVGVVATTPEELADAVVRLLASERERARLADNARRIAPQYSRERAAERLHKLVLRPLVEERRR